MLLKVTVSELSFRCNLKNLSLPPKMATSYFCVHNQAAYSICWHLTDVHSPPDLQGNHGKPFLSQKSSPLWKRPSGCGFSTCRITPTTNTVPGDGSRWRGLRGWTLDFSSTVCLSTRPQRCPGTAECAWRVWALATTSTASSSLHSHSVTTGMLRLLEARLMKPTASPRLTPLLWTPWSQTPCSSLHIHKRTVTWCLHTLTTPRQQSTSPTTPSPTTTATPSCTDTLPQLQSSPLSLPLFPLPTWDAPTPWPCITPSTVAPVKPNGTLAGQDSSPHLLTPTLTLQTARSRCITLSCWLRWTATSLSSIWVPLQRVQTWQACRMGHTRLACKDLKASFHRCCQTPAQLCITVATTTRNLLPCLLSCCRDTWSDLKSL